MAYCTECGAQLQQGQRFCPQCGAAQEPEARSPQPAVSYPARQGKVKKPIYKRWWFWVLIVLVAGSLFGRGGSRSPEPAQPSPELRAIQPSPAPVSTPRPTLPPKPTPAPTPTPLPDDLIRPDVKAFLDSYEACMNEYADFMDKYMNASPDDMLGMMGDYYSMLDKYTQFSEKIDALDEDDLTSAELAYYLEVTARVERRLLSVLG